MSAIDPASQLAALIRVQVASLRERRQAGTSASTRKSSGLSLPATTPTTASPASSASPDIAAIVAGRIRAIDANDSQRGRKAFRMFLETVILSELGQALANDPTFAVMLDHVQLQMESDPDIARAANDAAQFLLQAADAQPAS
ncbi:hypothetical protein [Caenimonas sp. SL110]|uniref:hypothetical protein n=1 Tax=Caenimonas sp. SL110 TaxID=1450524 RepID=UPI00128D674B|nr:hypothetical protein [Caenimonas sp. SL110]